jgi:hypothetical protein
MTCLNDPIADQRVGCGGWVDSWRAKIGAAFWTVTRSDRNDRAAFRTATTQRLAGLFGPPFERPLVLDIRQTKPKTIAAVIKDDRTFAWDGT